jgi:hypothetical protein
VCVCVYVSVCVGVVSVCVCIITNDKILHLKFLGRTGEKKNERKNYNQAMKQYPYMVT